MVELTHRNTGLDSPPAKKAAAISEGLLVVTVVLLLPIALSIVNLAALERTLYPATNLAVAALLFHRRSPWYAGHMVLIFCCVALVRRLVDEQLGFDPQNPVLLTPYLCGMFSAVDFLNYWRRRQPTNLGPLLAILLAVIYGVALAMVYGRTTAGAVDLLKWGLGPLFAVYILNQATQQAQIRAVVEGCLIWAGTAMAIYGIFQFLKPTSWDRLWMLSMIESGMVSMGIPEPFSLRVFSTMNSPGSFAAIMCSAILLAFKRKLTVAVPTVTLMMVGLAIAQYRTVWGATLLGAILIMAARPKALKPANVLAAVAVMLVMSSSAFVPRIQEAVVQRASSLSNLSADASLEDRLQQYQRMASEDNLLGGAGLGLSGFVRKLDNLPQVAIDGGLIEILRSLGAIVGTLYLIAVFVLIARLFQRRPAVAHDVDFDRALVVATFVQLPMGSVQIGEMGFCAWMYIGLGLATLSSARSLTHRAPLQLEPHTVHGAERPL